MRLLFFTAFSFTLLSLCLSWDTCDITADDAAESCLLPICPDCDLVDCFPELKPAHCPEGTIWEDGITYGGCCPACVKYLGLGEGSCRIEGGNQVTDDGRIYYTLPCSSDPTRFVLSETMEFVASGWTVPVVHFAQCPTGLSCHGKVCDYDEAIKTGCNYDKKLYNQFEYDGDDQDVILAECGTTMEKHWIRTCDLDNSYAPVQSKTNPFSQQNTLWCSNPLGKRIFGEAEAKDEEIECHCSRKSWELNQNYVGSDVFDQRRDLTMHCDTKGNYEPLQCDMGRCWCAEPKTGEALTKPVLEHLDYLLPCYDKSVYGDQYRRKCESRQYARGRAENIMERHGLTWHGARDMICGYDGSFGKTKCSRDDGQCRCVDPYGQQIKSYFIAISSAEGINCQCARDYYNGLTTLSCQVGLGNYNQIQTFFANEFCVDEDGYQYTASYSPNRQGKKCDIPNCEDRNTVCYLDPNLPAGTERPCETANTGVCKPQGC